MADKKPMAHSFYGAKDATREVTPSGALRSGAILTRAGKINYLRSELGLAGDGVVEINRTLQTISHPDTLASLRGAPITVGHPKGGVTPDNFKSVVVGSVSGEPRVAGDVVLGDVHIGDRGALERIDRGEDELSIGYDFLLGPRGDTVGGLRINHVAIVEAGRSGPSVRVLDSAKEGQVDKQEMMDAMSAAIDAAFTDMGFKKKGMDIDTADMSKKMMDALQPVMDGFKQMKDSVDSAAAKAEAETNRKKAEDAKTALIKTVRDEERARAVILADALPMVEDDKREALKGAEIKDVLVAAVGDAIPNAEKQSVDFLHGALQAIKARGDQSATDQLPPGVVPFTLHQAEDGGEVRRKAEDAFVASTAKTYADAGGI